MVKPLPVADLIKELISGALNHFREFKIETAMQLKLAHRREKFCCLLFLDIDGLKHINDTLGHEVVNRIVSRRQEAEGRRQKGKASL
ncbi:diguanylate cyclase [Nostocaceae cyanobacterium CENA369]|uniref:Diguanylate cyclase n=2 Tax=Dendronalium TaxID=2840442 RepID=A0A8J7LD81_9NOST|nr:diguanylate cyclase [Dendronalium phyllosphericum CENA369]